MQVILRVVGVLFFVSVLSACGGSSSSPEPLRVSLTTPAQGTIQTEQASILIGGTASVGAGDVVAVRVNGNAAQTINDFANWSYDLSLALGVTEVVVEAEDSAGNTALASQSVSIERVTTLANAAPTVAIDFPPPEWAIVSNFISVRGTSADADGVAAVSVNGVVATSDDNFATWVARDVPIDEASPMLDVAAQDTLGGYASLVNPRNLYAGAYISSISEMIYNPADQSLLTLSLAGSLTELIGIDVASGFRREFGRDIVFRNDLVLSPDNSTLFGLTTNSLISVNLTQEEPSSEVVSAFTVGTGPRWSTADAMAIDFASNRAFVLDGATATGLPDQDIIAVNLATGDRTVLLQDFEDALPNESTLTAMAHDGVNERLVLIVSEVDSVTFEQVARLVFIDTTAAEVTLLAVNMTDMTLAPQNIIDIRIDETNQIVYASSSEAVYQINLTSGDASTIMSSAINIELFENMSNLAFDVASQRLFVSAGQGAVPLQFNVGATTLTPLPGLWNLGNGPMTFAAELAYDENNDVLMKLAYETIESYDLSTGDRTQLSDDELIDRLDGEEVGFVLDTSMGMAYFSNTNSVGLNGQQVVSINLGSGAGAVVSDNAMAGPQMRNIAGLAYDEDAGLLYLADQGSSTSSSPDDFEAIYSIDAMTGARVVLSDANTGSGDMFVNMEHLAFDDTNDRLLGLDDAGLWIIDSTTGDREIVFTKTGNDCLTYDASQNRVLVCNRSDGLLAYDLNNPVPVVISNLAETNGPFMFLYSLYYDADAELSYSAFGNALFAIDMVTGDRVMVSL